MMIVFFHKEDYLTLFLLYIQIVKDIEIKLISILKIDINIDI